MWQYLQKSGSRCVTVFVHKMVNTTHIVLFLAATSTCIPFTQLVTHTKIIQKNLLISSLGQKEKLLQSNQNWALMEYKRVCTKEMFHSD